MLQRTVADAECTAVPRGICEVDGEVRSAERQAILAHGCLRLHVLPLQHVRALGVEGDEAHGDGLVEDGLFRGARPADGAEHALHGARPAWRRVHLHLQPEESRYVTAGEGNAEQEAAISLRFREFPRRRDVEALRGREGHRKACSQVFRRGDALDLADLQEQIRVVVLEERHIRRREGRDGGLGGNRRIRGNRRNRLP